MEHSPILDLGMIAVTAACIVGVLYICAACIRDATALHDVTVEARRLRIEFDRRVFARNTGGEAGEVEILPDDDEEPYLTV